MFRQKLHPDITMKLVFWNGSEKRTIINGSILLRKTSSLQSGNMKMSNERKFVFQILQDIVTQRLLHQSFNKMFSKRREKHKSCGWPRKLDNLTRCKITKSSCLVFGDNGNPVFHESNGQSVQYFRRPHPGQCEPRQTESNCSARGLINAGSSVHTPFSKLRRTEPFAPMPAPVRLALPK